VYFTVLSSIYYIADGSVVVILTVVTVIFIVYLCEVQFFIPCLVYKMSETSKIVPHSFP